MIRDLKAFYVAIINNEVVCFNTNLKLFVEEFTKIASDSRNYDWFYRQFKADSKFTHQFNGDKTYYFQKVV